MITAFLISTCDPGSCLDLPHSTAEFRVKAGFGVINPKTPSQVLRVNSFASWPGSAFRNRRRYALLALYPVTEIGRLCLMRTYGHLYPQVCAPTNAPASGEIRKEATPLCLPPSALLRLGFRKRIFVGTRSVNGRHFTTHRPDVG